MTTLYNLTGDYLTLLRQAGEPGDYAVALDQLQGEIDDKVEGCCAVYRELTAEAEKFAVESKRMADRAKALTNDAEHIKAYLHANMVDLGKETVQSGVFKASIQKNPPSCIIMDSSKIPDEYFKTVPESKVVMLNEIIVAWKAAGEVNIPGTETKRGTRLVIK